jgi:hypothetical protein
MPERRDPVQRSTKTASPPERFPWLLFLILLGTAYAFWVLPYQMGASHPKVSFKGVDHQEDVSP